ncbi:MAG: N-acetylmuramoyl-L-alanine amidase [Gaiellaceae bacterium]
MRPLLAAAVLALAAPGTAGAGLSLAARDMRAGAPQRVARFDLVGLHWRGSGNVFFRTRSLAGRWSVWRPGRAEDDLPDRGSEGLGAGWRIGNPYWTGGSDAIEYRAAGLVRGVRAFFVRSSGELRIRKPQLAAAPAIITRAEWGANEAIRRAPPRYADGVHLAVVHHTAGSNVYSASQSAAIVRAIELYHVQGNGWNDIGYNFLVDKYGQIFEGRYGGMTRPVIGAHAMGFNVGTVGVAVIGDYSAATVTPAAREALILLLAWRLDLAHVDPLSRVSRVSTGNPRYSAGTPVTLPAILGHRDVYPTTCPGASLYAQLPAIRAAVAGMGLPKLYDPAVSGVLGGPVRFTARLSSPVQWTVAVRDESGNVVASGGGAKATVDWTWDATTAPLDQQYAWTITAPGMRPATGTIGSAAPALALQQVKLAPVVVTPNGDGRDEEAKLTYSLTTRAVVTGTLLDASGSVVSTLFKQVRLPGAQSFVWKDITVPDGRYQVVLVAKDALGKQVQASTAVAVDRTLAAFSSSATAFSHAVEFRFRLYAPAHLQLLVRSGADTAATVFDGDLAAGSQRIAWDGSGLPDGRYSAVLSATDSLMTVEQSVPLTIDRVAPVLRLVSFRLLRFWLSEPARVTLTLGGRAYRVTVRRAGYFRIGHAPVRSLTAFAVDAAGNRSQIVRAKR